MRIFKSCFASVLAVTSLLISNALAEPAIWKVSDGDNEAWLLGSVHALNETTTWRTDLLEAALDEAEYFYYEASLSAATQESTANVVYERGIFNDGRTLSSLLNAEEVELLSQTANGLGLTLDMLEPMRPWLANITISGLAIRASGLNPESGIDYVLQAETDDAAERYFETPEEQIGFFADLAEEIQVATLVSTLRQLSDMPDMIGQLIELWSTGDAEGMDALVNQSMIETDPEVYAALIVQRNFIWLEEIDAFMAGSEDAFIVVGAGHLVGEDGLPSLLDARGFTVERVQ